MDAVLVTLKDPGMALPTNLGDMAARLIGRAHIVSAVAVGADGGVEVAGLRHLSMHAVLGLFIVFGVALLTGLVVDAGQFSPAFVLNFRMRVSFNFGMAGVALDPQGAVHRLAEILRGNI